MYDRPFCPGFRFEPLRIPRCACEDASPSAENLENLRRAKLEQEIADDSGFQNLLRFEAGYLYGELARCVAFVDAIEYLNKTQAGAASTQVSCALVPIALSVSGAGAHARLRSVQIGSPTGPAAAGDLHPGASGKGHSQAHGPPHDPLTRG